jgi:hypothetical protein
VEEPNVAVFGGTRGRIIHLELRDGVRVVCLGKIRLPAVKFHDVFYPGAGAGAGVAVTASRILEVLFRRVRHLADDLAPFVVGLQGEGGGGISVRGEILRIFMLVVALAVRH